MSKLWSSLVVTLHREKLLFISNLIIMTVTFLVLGLFIGLVIFSQSILRRLEQQAPVTIFFKDDFTENKIMELKNTLEQDERVLNITYISKEEAFKVFTEVHKDQPILLGSASKEILPASLRIRAKKISDLEVMAKELTTLDGVEYVKFFRDAVENFKTTSTIMYIVGLILVSIFILISYSIVIITLRTSISSKGTELEILKLVGASDSYVKSPLIFQGVFLSISSAVLASIILIGISLTIYFTKTTSIVWKTLLITQTISVNLLIFTALLSVILILSGATLGFLGSWTAIKRYLEY